MGWRLPTVDEMRKWRTNPGMYAYTPLISSLYGTTASSLQFCSWAGASSIYPECEVEMRCYGATQNSGSSKDGCYSVYVWGDNGGSNNSYLLSTGATPNNSWYEGGHWEDSGALSTRCVRPED